MDSLQSLVALVSLLLLILLPNFQFTSSKKTTSFSLKLIHRDSPESPLYPGPMTLRERVERNMKYSESRIINLYNRNVQPNMMRPPISPNGLTYLVKLEIGTSVNNIYYLLLDTGSGLTWMQCQPCKKCYEQKYPIYDPRQSQTFKQVPCDNPLCSANPRYTCTNNQCTYTSRYFDGATSEGYAAWETFRIKDEQGITTEINDVFFGCSNLNSDIVGNINGLETGIMGLDQSPESFITQLGSLIMRRFSYCLVNPFNPGSPGFSYLKFGVDMGYIGGPVQKTPFVKQTGHAYALNLLDISINNKRMNFPPDTFKFRPETRTGGFTIDSGSIMTYIDSTAYQKLEDEFVKYFSAFKQLQRRQLCPYPARVCYDAPVGFPLFPSMTYHFEGADLAIKPENAILAIQEEKFFLVPMVPSPISILGSFQQQNTRFTYDLGLNLLAFNPEDCSRDS